MTLPNISLAMFLSVAMATVISAADGAAVDSETAPESQATPKVVLTKDDHGRVIQKTVGDDPTNVKIWRYEFDQKGLLLKETDPMGVPTLYTHDALGRITEVKRGDDLEIHKTVVTYDAQGKITGVTVDGLQKELPEAPEWRDHDLYIGDEKVY